MGGEKKKRLCMGINEFLLQTEFPFSAFTQMLYADNLSLTDMRRQHYFVTVVNFFLLLRITFHPAERGNLKEKKKVIFAFPGNVISHVL